MVLTPAAVGEEEASITSTERSSTTKCASPNCTVLLDKGGGDGKPALLACPKCLQLGLPPSYFCGQECFRENYAVHKRIHTSASKLVKEAAPVILDGVACLPTADSSIKLSLPTWARSYSFTGPLRPCLYSPQRTVTKPTVKLPDYATHPQGVSESEQWDRRYNGNNSNAIRIYTEDELKTVDDPTGLRHACAMGREVLDLAGKALRVGVTTDEIDRLVFDACMERDVYPSPLNYYNFPKSLCTSINEVVCHGIPDYRELQAGDIVNLDISVYNQGGYHADLNETYMMGDVDADSRRLVETSFQCLANAVAMVQPGTLYRDLGTVIERTAKQNGCSVVRTYCGHGIGSLFHTSPNVPHYAKNKAKGIMKVGHVFTIEPMINLGSYSDRTWDDNWTSVTSDGQRSSQFEHTFLVTETGYEILTARENEPVMRWDPQLNTR
jgi:methionyl aminopeptidase